MNRIKCFNVLRVLYNLDIQYRTFNWDSSMVEFAEFCFIISRLGGYSYGLKSLTSAFFSCLNPEAGVACDRALAHSLQIKLR